MLGGCAPGGYASDPDSLVATQDIRSPSMLSQTNSVPVRFIALDGAMKPPAIADCQGWKIISRKIYSAPPKGIPINDYIGETLRDVYKKGWPEEAAKRLFVSMLAAYSEEKVGEEQFIEEQFKKCSEMAARSGPKYSNVNIGLYWSAEKKAQADQSYQRAQIAQTRRNQLLGPCLQYQAKALMVPVYKSNGFTLEQAAEYVAASAYGPGAIAYRNSQETEALLIRLVQAGYQSPRSDWRDESGRPTNNFAEYAFAQCIKGAPF